MSSREICQMLCRTHKICFDNNNDQCNVHKKKKIAKKKIKNYGQHICDQYEQGQQKIKKKNLT